MGSAWALQSVPLRTLAHLDGYLVMQVCRLLLLFLSFFSADVFAQTGESVADQRAVQLRGSVTAERAWWDLQRYDLKIEVDPKAKTIQGTNQITFVPMKPGNKLQIDLQAPLKIESVKAGDQDLKFVREGGSGNVDSDYGAGGFSCGFKRSTEKEVPRS